MFFLNSEIKCLHFDFFLPNGGGSDQPAWIACSALLLGLGRHADLNIDMGLSVSLTFITAMSDWTYCGLPLPLLIVYPKRRCMHDIEIILSLCLEILTLFETGEVFNTPLRKNVNKSFLKVEVFEFAVSTNEILRKVTTDQSEA